jgi:uncharacterized protein DUF1670
LYRKKYTLNFPNRRNPIIKTTAQRKAESIERLHYRSSNQTLQNVITEGTSCSPFEASIISEKAEEILCVGKYSQENVLQPGQMIWNAICEKEPPGKPISSCSFETIRLTVHRLEDDIDVHKTLGRSAMRGQQILRMTLEAQDQGALLTQEDLGIILDCDVKTIRNDIKELQKRIGILVPTRGNRKDIGPGITHRDKIIELYLKGKDAVSISRDMNHSLKAVERYISSFCRIFHCQRELKNTLKTALVVGVSVGLVNKYLELADRHRGNDFYEERLSEIEKVGKLFWEAQDGKKKLGRKKRRQQ